MGWRPSGKNPCRLVRRYKVEKTPRAVRDPEELHRLGQTLSAAPGDRLASAHSAAAIRLLVLTGCRLNEIPGLRKQTKVNGRLEGRGKRGSTATRVNGPGPNRPPLFVFCKFRMLGAANAVVPQNPVNGHTTRRFPTRQVSSKRMQP